MHTKTEGALQRYLFARCKDVGVMGYKLSSPAKRGVPDVLLIYKGRVVFVELKSPAKTGKLSPLQKHEINLLANQDAEVYVIDEYEQVDELIAAIATELRPADYHRQAVQLRPYPPHS